MKPSIRIFVITAALCAAPWISVAPAEAEEVDFSCVREWVRGKTQLYEGFKEYDVILHNQCPGEVYWKMCIERIDPWTREVVEVHTPAGYLEEEKKSRVNLQMKKGPDGRFRNRFQEFYVNVGYSIRTAAQVDCVASRCEQQNGAVLRELRANEDAWEAAEKALTARIERECPDSGWNSVDRDACAAEIRQSVEEEMAHYGQTDQRLREQLAAVIPEHCRIRAGARVED
ncbi:MAG: hypothetical protein HKP03_05065 [Xanthomonadales bacterium]|nr:hypothetical protein [Xanthomonadales bacterium]